MGAKLLLESGTYQQEKKRRPVVAILSVNFCLQQHRHEHVVESFACSDRLIWGNLGKLCSHWLVDSCHHFWGNVWSTAQKDILLYAQSGYNSQENFSYGLGGFDLQWYQVCNSDPIISVHGNERMLLLNEWQWAHYGLGYYPKRLGNDCP